MLIAIFNHNNTSQALNLKRGFSSLAETFLVDSGSRLTAAEMEEFDVILPNVYYCGMLNAIGDQLQETEEEVVLFIASDVEVEAPELLVKHVMNAFNDEMVGVYAPSVNPEGSNHPQMRHKLGSGLVPVPFVDGFCFALRKPIYSTIHPIDLNIQKVGWGVDTFLAFKCHQSGYECRVDHSIKVKHYVGPNNLETTEAKAYLHRARSNRKDWYAQLEKDPINRRFRLFRKLLHFSFFKNRFGAHIFHFLFRNDR